MSSSFNPNRLYPHRSCLFTHGLIIVFCLVFILGTITHNWVYLLAALGIGTFFMVLLSLLYKGETTGEVPMVTRRGWVHVAIVMDLFFVLGAARLALSTLEGGQDEAGSDPDPVKVAAAFVVTGAFALVHAKAVRRAHPKPEAVKV